MEAKTKNGTFLAESCGRASAPTTQKYHFFDAAPYMTGKMWIDDYYFNKIFISSIL